MRAGISESTRPAAAKEPDRPQIINNRPLAVSLPRPDEFLRLARETGGPRTPSSWSNRPGDAFRWSPASGGLRSRDRRRLRRSGARWGEPQRGGGVDPGVRGHDAPVARAAVGERGRIRLFPAVLSRGDVSGGGAQGLEQVTNVRGGHADTTIGGTVGEVHVVTVAGCSLDEHDVVRVAPALPVELRLEDWLGEAAVQPTGGLVQQRQVDRVRAVGAPFVEKE